MSLRRAVIVDIVRSPFGRGRVGGGLSHLHPVDLYARILQALLRRTGIDPLLVEDVITGCVLQVGEQAANIGRQAVLAAGLPETIPAVTLDRKCGSSQQAMAFAAQSIIAGAHDVVVAGGVEMMSRVPMKSNRMGRDNLGPMLRARYPAGLVNQGIAAELIAAKWRLSRDAQDHYALQSHRRAAKARDIVTADIEPLDGIEKDEGIRPDTSMEALAGLRPAFQDDAMQMRFPQIRWSVTAGNSSQITDGAGAMLLVEEAVAARLGLKPRVAVTGFTVVGDDPIMMLTGPISATRKLLARKKLAVKDIAAFEVNEAFASVVLAWLRELNVDDERVNQLGGAIALGHPVGASAIRLTANLIHSLEQSPWRGPKLGIQTMCESGGMANATLFEAYV